MFVLTTKHKSPSSTGIVWVQIKTKLQAQETLLMLSMKMLTLQEDKYFNVQPWGCIINIL